MPQRTGNGLGIGTPERLAILADFSRQVRGVYVPGPQVSSNVDSLLKSRRTRGEVEYQRRLGAVRAWADQARAKQLAEQQEGNGFGGFIRRAATVVRKVAPVVIGGLVGAGLERLRARVPVPSPARPARPGAVRGAAGARATARPASRAAAVRAKIPYHLYAALAQQGDPRAEQLRLRGLVAPPVQAAAPSSGAAVQAEIARQQLYPTRTRRLRAAGATAPRRQMLWGLQPGDFGL